MGEVQLSNKEIIFDYNRIYSGPGIRTNSGYYRWIVKLLGLKPGKTILDVSCGEGIFLREVLRKFKLTRASGLDISDIAVSIAKRRSPDPGFVVADGQRIPFKDKSFDYVTCLGSLEHYLDQDLGLREIRRVAKDDADIVIVTGGLGPTDDDITRQAFAELLGVKLQVKPALLKDIRKFFADMDAEKKSPWH